MVSVYVCWCVCVSYVIMLIRKRCNGIFYLNIGSGSITLRSGVEISNNKEEIDT